MSLNGASLWKIDKFLSIQGDFEPFQHHLADLSSIDRIKTSYGAIVGDYPQHPELDNLSFFRPIGWFLVNLPHKSAQNETVGRILAWWKMGLLLGYLPRPRIKFAAIRDSSFGNTGEELKVCKGDELFILGIGDEYFWSLLYRLRFLRTMHWVWYWFACTAQLYSSPVSQRLLSSRHFFFFKQYRAAVFR